MLTRQLLSSHQQFTGHSIHWNDDDDPDAQDLGLPAIWSSRSPISTRGLSPVSAPDASRDWRDSSPMTNQPRSCFSSPPTAPPSTKDQKAPRVGSTLCLQAEQDQDGEGYDNDHDDEISVEQISGEFTNYEPRPNLDDDEEGLNVNSPLSADFIPGKSTGPNTTSGCGRTMLEIHKSTSTLGTLEELSEPSFASGCGSAMASPCASRIPLTAVAETAERRCKMWRIDDGPPPQEPADAGRLTVVFDLDETLVYSRHGVIEPRPFLAEMLEMIKDKCEVIVWTSSMYTYAKTAMDTIDNKIGAIRYCICQDDSPNVPSFDQCPAFNCLAQVTSSSSSSNTAPMQVKDLRLLGRSMDQVLMIENCAACVARNPVNAVIVPDFDPWGRFSGACGVGLSHADTVLMSIAQMVLDMVDRYSANPKSVTVPSYLVVCPQVSMELLPDEHDRYFATMTLKAV